MNDDRLEESEILSADMSATEMLIVLFRIVHIYQNRPASFMSLCKNATSQNLNRL